MDRWNRKALGLVLAMLVLAVGFCIFDGDGHHENDRAGFDLCLGMLGTTMTISLVSRLPLSGLASADRFVDVLEFTPLVPAPPPKSALS